MYLITKGFITFKGDLDTLELIGDYCDTNQIGEFSFDKEEDNVALLYIDDEFEEGKESLIDFFANITKEYKEIEIIAVGTYFDTIDRAKHFEIRYEKEYLKYRETEWLNDKIDKELSYEEYQEGVFVDVDESEFLEGVCRAEQGIESDIPYNEWEYIDILEL